MPNNCEQVSTRFGWPVDMDAGLAVGNIGSDKSAATARVLEDDTALPAHRRVTQVMSADDEPGEKTLGNDGISIAEVQTFGRRELARSRGC